jgi:hypothetical protein
MGVFVDKHGIVKYLTGSKISEVLQSVAKACHSDLTRDELMHFSSHSGRVWAIIILDEAGMLPDFIKSRLRWMGNSYRLYLRDISILQQKHLTALDRALTKFTPLFGKNRMTLPDVVPVDDTMDSYQYYFSFLFACLQYIAALSYCRQICTWSTSFCLLSSGHKEACMPLWRFGLAARTFGVKNLPFFGPHIV